MKKTFIGKVVSDKMQNTVAVEIERKFQHKIYKKMITRTKKMLADNNVDNIKIGDMVKIEETKPISKNKYFKVIKKV
ncbi:30S ribosomal protein S17 [Candidatus Parcubacteria bacterium]|nr:MAG: 30S ribosomal protein S17 [Candidatus Parcubacteria bacterium]